MCGLHGKILFVVAYFVIAAFGLKDVSSTETDPPTPIAASPSPPNDLLFESIKEELSVNQDMREPPEKDLNPKALETTRLGSAVGETNSAAIGTNRDHRPWKTIESLLKAARDLDRRAKRFETNNSPALASTLREKSLMIREITVEILVLTQNLPDERTQKP